MSINFENHKCMKHIKTFLVSAVLAAAVSACGSGGGNKTTTSETDTPETGIDETTMTSEPKTMIMTTTNDELRFGLSGSGTATIAWGNQKETAELLEDELKWFHLAIPDINSRTVTLSGEITGFECAWGGITELDVRRNTALTNLSLNVNQLARLDLSKNSTLTYLDVKANQFTAETLNDLFGSLHGKGGIINIAYNPGTDDCNTSIAEAKGWTVEIVELEEN